MSRAGGVDGEERGASRHGATGAAAVTLLGPGLAGDPGPTTRAVDAATRTLRQVFDGLPNALVAYDALLRVIDCNPAAAVALATTRELLIGTDMTQVPDQGPLPLLRRALAGEMVTFEGRYRPSRSGEERPFKAILQPLRDEHGAIVGVLSITSDVAAIDAADAAARRAQAAARLAEDRVRAMFDATPLPIYAWQVRGDDVVLIEYNAVADRATRGRLAPMLGRSAVALYGPGSPYEADLRGCLADNQPRRREFDYQLIATGETRRFDASYIPVPPELVLVVANDVTDQHRLGEQLRQSQKLEAIGLLAGGIAHDFNNLLTVIQGAGEFLAEDLGPAHPSADDVEAIRGAAARASVLTTQLLAFSRKQLFQPRPVAVDEVVERLQPMLRRLLGEDLRVVFDRGPGEQVVLADPGQLDQVVLNLALNARDAMPRGGKLTLGVARRLLDEEDAAALGLTRTGAFVELRVRDTGTGMDAATRARIFEPFFTTKAPGRGTGLGLSMVYGFVQQAHGEILVDSAVGIGTTFRILLPIATGCPDAVAPAAAPPPSVDRRRATVLVVEDDADVREISSQILTRLGYVVLTARDGREALALAETHAGTLECVISDLIMPGQSGVAVVGLLRARWPALRVLYVSGYDDDAIVRHGGSSSDGAFLRKPFTPEALAIAVDHALAGVPTVA